MSGMSNENQGVAFLSEADGLRNGLQSPADRSHQLRATVWCGLSPERVRRDAMSTEDANRIFRHVLKSIDENFYLTLAQVLNHMPVMDDLVKDIDRNGI